MGCKIFMVHARDPRITAHKLFTAYLIKAASNHKFEFCCKKKRPLTKPPFKNSTFTYNQIVFATLKVTRRCFG